ncbi:MAG: hypothetical protein GEV13_18915 [Rhodospirillales bacterium]|nr:hypothetical protein [Rhodospirillales bacterium]
MPDGSNFIQSVDASSSAVSEHSLRPKPPCELVEYSASLFDTSLDDTDRKAPWRDGVGHTGSSPELQRLYDLLPRVVAILGKRDAANRVRRMIEAMGLSLPRLERLRSCLSSAPRWPGKTEDHERKAYKLIQQASSEMLLSVKPGNTSDLLYLIRLAASTDLPKARRRALLATCTRGLRRAMANKPIDGRPLGVLEIVSNHMAPHYPAGSKVVVSHVKRTCDVVIGRDYGFVGRKHYSYEPLTLARLTGATRRAWLVEFLSEPGKITSLPRYVWRPAYAVERGMHG